jgi:hypothetical protein
MNIPKPLKIFLLLLTLWVPLYMIGFMFMIGSMSMIDFDLLWKLHLGTMATMAVTTVVYIVHLFKTRSVAPEKKALWGIALFCGAPIAMPIYFFTHVWPEAPAWPEVVVSSAAS